MKNIIDEFINDFNEIKDWKIKQHIPNILTLLRGLSPFIVIPTMIANRLDIILIELILLSLTDFFDGKLARKYNCVSRFGSKLDALCDKIYALTIIVPSTVIYPFLTLNLLTEGGIGYVNIRAMLNGRQPNSNIIGKIKTAFLSGTIILTYIPRLDILFIIISSIATFALQIIALVKYMNNNYKFR